MKVLASLFIAGLVACSASSAEIPDCSADTHDAVETSGPLSLVARDAPTVGGIDFTSAFVTAAPGALIVQRTQYGSLCQLAVRGTANIQGTKIDLHVSFDQRTGICCQDFRALSYSARVSTTPGTYDVTVIEDEGGRADTVAQRQVTVP